MPYKNPADEIARSRRYRARQYAAVAVTAPKYNLDLSIVKPLRIAVPQHGLKIAYIPDVQAMAGVPLDHLKWAGKYIARKRPDVIVIAGDFGDVTSLSHHSRPLEREGMRYRNDIAAVRKAMDLLMDPIHAERRYKPFLEFITGNHEEHIDRYVREHPEMEGVISLDDFGLAEYGWRVHPFLQPVAIGGVAFCHYFPSGVMGRPITSAAALLGKLHMSAVAGHIQGRDIAYGRRADGAHMTAIISGAFYQHSFKFLSPFTNAHWRGMWMFHEVRDGQFDEMALSIDYLKRRFA